jgi:hypothetical protein
MDDMNSNPLPSSPENPSRHSWIGIASCVAGGLAVLSVLISLIAIFSPAYWTSEGNNLIDSLKLPWVALFLVLLGSGLGIGSLFHAGTKKTFGILGLALGGFTLTICLCLFGLIFVSSGGFGG